MMFLIGIASISVQAEDSERTRKSLRGIGAISVLVEELPDNAKVLGLSKDTMQNDVEFKHRSAGMRVVTNKEDLQLPGMPTLYVNINLTDGVKAANIEIELGQNVWLERNGQLATTTTTWSTGYLFANPTAQGIRNALKDRVDMFLNAWLSVNPKK
jgi:hypothetical protein